MKSLPYLVPNYLKNWHMCCQCLVLSFDIRFVAIENFVFRNWVQMGNSIFRFPGGEKCFRTKNIPVFIHHITQMLRVQERALYVGQCGLHGSVDSQNFIKID